MNAKFFLTAIAMIIATSAQAWGQAGDDARAMRAAGGFGGYWGAGDYGYHFGGSDAIGDAARGAAAIIRSTGEAVRNESEAVINIETAKSQYLRNNYDAAKTFWDKRRPWTENSA